MHSIRRILSLRFEKKMERKFCCVACVACSAHGKIYATRGICNIWGESKLPPMWYLMSEKLLFCACLHLIEEDIKNSQLENHFELLKFEVRIAFFKHETIFFSRTIESNFKWSFTFYTSLERGRLEKQIIVPHFCSTFLPIDLLKSSKLMLKLSFQFVELGRNNSIRDL